MEDISYGVILVVALVGGLIAGAIAGGKGRSFGGFFLLGAFFPLIGIIAAAVARPSIQVEAQRAVAVERAKQHLGDGYAPAPPPPPESGQPASPPPPEKTAQSQFPVTSGLQKHTTCPSCGVPIESSAVKCSNCGASRYTCGACGAPVKRTWPTCSYCHSSL